MLAIYILPTPLHKQDAKQGQFLRGVQQVWIQSFPFSKTGSHTKLKNQVCPTIYR